MSTTEQKPPKHAATEGTGSVSLLGAPVPAAGASNPFGRDGSTLLRHLVFLAIAIVVLYGGSYFVEPFTNYQLGTVAAYLCTTAALTVLIGLNGQLSLGHGAIMAVGAYTTVIVQNAFDEAGNTAIYTMFVALILGTIAATVAGLLLGLAAARLRGPYLAGLTLAVAVVVPAITRTFEEVFNADQGLSMALPAMPDALGPNFPLEQWQAWIAVGGALITMFFLANLVRSRVGRSFRAVRDDEVSAQLAGINIARTQILAFTVSSAAAGVGGAVFAVLSIGANPGAFSLLLSLYLLLAIVIGGLGSLAGAVWGAIFLVALPAFTGELGENLSTTPLMEQRLTGNLPLAVFGLTLIVVMIVAPGGIQTLLRRIGRWLKGLRRPASR